MQGLNNTDVDRVAELDLEHAKLTEKERALLAFVKVLTLEPAKVRDSHVEAMRKVGWTDEEIFEGAFITALFAFFNRMADAYGLDYPMDRWLPPDRRPEPKSAEKNTETPQR